MNAIAAVFERDLHQQPRLLVYAGLLPFAAYTAVLLASVEPGCQGHALENMLSCATLIATTVVAPGAVA